MAAQKEEIDNIQGHYKVLEKRWIGGVVDLLKDSYGGLLANWNPENEENLPKHMHQIILQLKVTTKEIVSKALESLERRIS